MASNIMFVGLLLDVLCLDVLPSNLLGLRFRGALCWRRWGGSCHGYLAHLVRLLADEARTLIQLISMTRNGGIAEHHTPGVYHRNRLHYLYLRLDLVLV